MWANVGTDQWLIRLCPRSTNYEERRAKEDQVSRIFSTFALRSSYFLGKAGLSANCVGGRIIRRAKPGGVSMCARDE